MGPRTYNPEEMNKECISHRDREVRSQEEEDEE